jgi:hypothetical protein
MPPATRLDDQQERTVAVLDLDGYRADGPVTLIHKGRSDAGPLGPLIRASAAYQRTQVSSGLFNGWNYYLWLLTYKWTKIGHTNKPKLEIKDPVPVRDLSLAERVTRLVSPDSSAHTPRQR